MLRICKLTAVAGALMVSAAAGADEWPSRPVRMINTFAVGGTADILTRIVAEHFSTVFKQQFYVETRAGAGGTIGVKTAIESPPDGYNFVLTNVSHLALIPISNPKIGYDPIKDLTNLGYIAGSPVMISVNPSSGVTSIKEFIAWAQRSPKPLTYSSSGIGSAGHLAGETFAQMAGIKVEHVPYRGASQGLTDLAGSHIAFASQTVSSTAALVRGGTLTALAVTSKERLHDFPNVPTMKELGYDLVSTIWFALSGPPGLPNDIVQKVNSEMMRLMAKPEMQQRLQQDGLVADPMTVDQLKAFIISEQARWKAPIERAGLIGKL